MSRISILAVILSACVIMALTRPWHLAAAPQNVPSNLEQARAMEKTEDYAGAERIYRQALLHAPDDPEILLRLGQICQRQLKFDESISLFERILKRAPSYPQANLLLGISYYALNQFEKAALAVKKELQTDPKNRRARYYLALASNAAGRPLEAIEQMESLRSDFPQEPEYLYHLARFYKAAANKAAQQLAHSAPDSEWYHSIRGEVAADSLQYSEAIREYKEVLAIRPGFPGIHFALGEIYWRKKEYDDAQRHLALALQEDPNQPLAHFYLADILTSNKEPQQAIPHLAVTLAAYPELAQAHFLMGKCYAATGEIEKGIQSFQEAARIDPLYKDAHYQLHLLYAKLNQKDKSQEHLRIHETLTRQEAQRQKEDLEKSLQRQSTPAQSR